MPVRWRAHVPVWANAEEGIATKKHKKLKIRKNRFVLFVLLCDIQIFDYGTGTPKTRAKLATDAKPSHSLTFFILLPGTTI